MFVGLLFAIGACFVWGLIFVVPQMLDDYTTTEVVLGRYLSYGFLSAFLFFRRGFSRLRQYSLKIWARAFLFALLSSLVYYFGLVIGLRFATPTLTVLIVGLAPIVIAFYGNWQTRELAFRDLFLPCLWIIFGLVLVNAIEVDWTFKSKPLVHYLLGFLGVLMALLSWSWFAVHNARFLKKNPQILASEWTTVIGVATLFWTLLVGAVFAITMKEEVEIAKFLTLSSDTLRYLMGAFLLGVFSSWFGCFLWSKASIYLPISLMGPLLIFETLFGLLFVFLFQKQLPTWFELSGAIAMMGGILMSVNAFRKKRLIEH